MANRPNVFADFLRRRPHRAQARKLAARSRQWFTDVIDSILGKTRIRRPKSVSAPQDVNLKKPDKRISRASKPLKSKKLEIGKMYTFHYNPKHKKKLPYYDRFPLIFVINVYNDGFLGINLHYISPFHRAQLLSSLYSLIDMDDKDRLEISYDILNSASRFSYFKPCVKRYLTAYLVSDMRVIEVEDWEKVIHLPSERFIGASSVKVWQDSASKF